MKGNAIDQVIRETLRPDTILKRGLSRNMAELRATLHSARKFVLDESMSAFMADLASVPFAAVTPERRPDIMESLRHGARLPHQTTWIEYDTLAFRRRLIEVSPSGMDPQGKPLGADDLPWKLGWLFERHPKVPDAVSMQEFVICGDDGPTPLAPMALPWRCVWNTVDENVPWVCDNLSAMLAHGLTGFASPFMGVVHDGPNPRMPADEQWHRMIVSGERTWISHYLMVEYAGALRYALAFLATLNDIPVSEATVRPSKGYVARGRYRKFVDHTVLSLNVPQRTDTAKVARRLIALARRRAHGVRGHWRLYRRGATLCPEGVPHVWDAADLAGHSRCHNCDAWRTWIEEHQRGDASLGIVTHDYAVTHRRN
jgi:hypothetical protein